MGSDDGQEDEPTIVSGQAKIYIFKRTYLPAFLALQLPRREQKRHVEEFDDKKRANHGREQGHKGD